MELLYSGREFLVCIKPVGMDSEHDIPRLLQEQLGGQIYTLHRLDKNVGGVMLYARTKDAAAKLSALIQNGQLIKEYVALVHGSVPADGDWEDLLFKDSRQNKVFVVKRQRTGVKTARLTFRRISWGENSLVRIRLHTGRSHQIRVQFSSRGYPLIGDHKYGARDQVPYPMLYSCCLRFSYNNQSFCFEHIPDWAN